MQSILIKYNLIEASTKSILLKYFQKCLRLSILAKLQNENLKVESFIQIVKKAVVAKAKSNLQL